MTENELRKAVVAQATAWYGCNEADGAVTHTVQKDEDGNIILVPVEE